MVDRGKVSDRRRSGWFRVDNAVLDRFGAELGPYGIAVYAAISRRASAKDSAWVSINGIAKLIGCSRSQVKRELAKLCVSGLIEVVPVFEGERQFASEYILNDVGDAVRSHSGKDTPTPVHTDPGSHRTQVHTEPTPVHTGPGGRSTQNHLKKDTYEKETSKEDSSLRDFARLTALMTKLRLSTAMPSLVLSAEELAALRSSGYRRELEKIEGERRPVRPDRVK